MIVSADGAIPYSEAVVDPTVQPLPHAPAGPLTLRDLDAIPVGRLRGVTERKVAALAQVGITSVLDLLTFYPRRWVDRTDEAHIGDLQPGREALVLVTVVAFLAGWGVRFRLVGVSSFTLLLAISCLAFAVSYVPRVSIPGARSVPVVFDNGSDLVIAAAAADLAAEAIQPTLEELARNVHGSGRTSEDGFVHVRLRRVEPATAGAGKPVVLGEAQIELATGTVILNP